MAKSGSFNTSKFSGDVGTSYLTLSWSIKSQDIATNKTVISWTLKGAGTTGAYYYKAGSFKVVINGATVYSSATRIELYAGTTVASGTATIAHKTDGTKTFTASAEAAIYYGSVNCSGEDTFTLDPIPRYGTCSHSINSKTETTIKMNWESDSTVDYIWYSKDNGSNWTGVNVTDGKSGTYTISGLSANTAYKIKTRIRRKDSQLTTDSSTLSVTTYDYPYCTSSPNFVLGDQLTLKFYNPLGRSFVFYIIGNGTQIDVEYKCSSTEYKGVNSTETSVPYLYATIPRAKSAKYKVKVVYGGVTKTRDNGNTYTIKESECYPTFTTFTYADSNADVVKVTGSNQILVKGLSNVTVSIDAANKMVAKHSASPSHYIVQLDTHINNANYSAQSIGIPLWEPTSAGKKRLSVWAYDSRQLFTLRYKDITVYDYNPPVVNATATRLNNYEAQTTIKVSGTYSTLTINSANKNQLKKVEYRYRETGGTWSGWESIPFTVSGSKYTCNEFMLSLDNSKSFEFEFLATDTFRTGSKDVTVDVGQAIFFISTNKKKCYSNGEEVTTNDNVRGMKYYTQLAEGADLNKITEIGTYRSIQASHTNTMHNLPATFDGGFTLYVSNWTATPANTQHRRQEVVYGRMTYVRRTIDYGETWTDWNTLALVEDMFPVGSVVCRSTKTNPSATLGGTWELIDKGFKSVYDTNDSGFTAATNVVNGGTHYSVGDHTVRIRQKVTVNTEMTDTGMSLGTFNWGVFGLSNMPMGINDGVAYSDGANGGISWTVAYTGGVTQTDVFDVTSIASGGSFHIDFTFVAVPSLMLDSYCDKFYWKRTS